MLSLPPARCMGAKVYWSEISTSLGIPLFRGRGNEKLIGFMHLTASSLGTPVHILLEHIQS